MEIKEGHIICLRHMFGIYIVEQVPKNNNLYGVHKYDNKYNLIFVKKEDILPLATNYCFHSFKTVDIGVSVKNEITYCSNCGIKITDIENILKGS